MLLDYHSFYGSQEQPTPPAGGGAYFPFPLEPPTQPRRRREREVVRAALDATLPAMEQQALAHVEAHGRLDAKLPLVQQQAAARATLRARVDLPLPGADAAGAAQAASGGTADMRLAAAAASGSIQLRAAGAVDAALPHGIGEGVAAVRLVATVTAQGQVPAADVEATASAIPPTRITEIDLDAQEDGWTDERLLIAAARLLLEDEDE